jgi:hypothetical protein
LLPVVVAVAITLAAVVVVADRSFSDWLKWLAQ